MPNLPLPSPQLQLGAKKKLNLYKGGWSLDAFPRQPFPHHLLSMMSAISLPPSDISLDELYRLLKPVAVDGSSSGAVFQNWGRTFRCRPSSVFRPSSEHQLELIVELARREKQTVRAVGIGHSPSDLACTSGYMIQMHRLDEIIEVRHRIAELAYLIGVYLSPRSLTRSVFGTPGLLPF